MKRLLLLIFAGMSITLAAQPANDNCVDAIPIMLDSVVDFTTIDATTDGAIHTNCFGANDSIPADVWFTWTPTTSGSYNWSNCSTADYDSRIAIYENAVACPPSDAELIGCNDDGPSDCLSNTSTLSFFGVAGSTYTFRMGGYSGDPDSTGSTGLGTVILTSLPDGPANDFCANAQIITLGLGQNFTTNGALIDGPNHPGNSSCFGFGFSTIFADVWFSYTADITGTVQWNTCGTINFDSRMAVYNPGSACPPVDSDLYVCNDDSGCDGFHSTLNIDVISGETYLLRLGGYDAEDGDGTFDLIEIIPPEPPINDLCGEATEAILITPKEADAFEVGISSGTTVNATGESGLVLPHCFSFNPGGDFSDVWYSINNDGRTSLELRFFPLTPGSVFFIDFYESCGNQLDTSFIGSCFQNLATTDIRDTVYGLSDVPTNYLVRILTRLTSEIPGEFILQIVKDDNLISSTQEINAVHDFRISPNPVTDIVQLNFSLDQPKTLSYSILNAMGKVMHKSPFTKQFSGSISESVNLSNYPQGIYFISLSDGIHNRTKRVIKL